MLKNIICGGFLFVGGCILYAVGTLGVADVAVQAYMMQSPQYMGIFFIIAGLALGVSGIKKKD